MSFRTRFTVHSVLQFRQYYSRLDQCIGALDRHGALLGITSDHGHSNKSHVVNLLSLAQRACHQWIQSDQLDAEAINNDSESGDQLNCSLRLVSDGHLGSFAMIDVSRQQCAAVCQRLGGREGVLLSDQQHQELCLALLFRMRRHRFIYSALSRKDASDAMDLDSKQVGDLVLLCQDWAVGADSSQCSLPAGFSSHGGLGENTVPLILNRTPPDHQQLNRGKGRNFHLLDTLMSLS